MIKTVKRNEKIKYSNCCISNSQTDKIKGWRETSNGLSGDAPIPSLSCTLARQHERFSMGLGTDRILILTQEFYIPRYLRISHTS